MPSKILKTTYNYLPGDYPNYGGTCPMTGGFVCSGNGDGLVSRISNPPAANEMFSAWVQLKTMGLLPNLTVNYSSPIGAAFEWYPLQAGIGAPYSAYNKNASWVLSYISGYNGLYYNAESVNKNSLSLVSLKPSDYTIYGAVKTVDVLAIDKKIDDGYPLSGNILGNNTANCIASATAYILSYTNQDACRLTFVLDEM